MNNSHNKHQDEHKQDSVVSKVFNAAEHAAVNTLDFSTKVVSSTKEHAQNISQSSKDFVEDVSKNSKKLAENVSKSAHNLAHEFSSEKKK